MRTTFLLAGLILMFSACKKDKYTTAPQIKFKSLDPDFAISGFSTTLANAPKITLEITDAEGDLGFIKGSDTSKIFIKNLLSANIDSFILPNLQTAAVKNFKADVIVTLFNSLDCIEPSSQWPVTDTTYYEVYVVDFAKNKSNVIVTERPVYFRCQ